MKLYGYDWPHGGAKQVVYVDDQGHVVELCVGLNGQWQSANLTALLRRRAAKKAASEETGMKT